MAEYNVTIRTLKEKARELEQLNAMLNTRINSLQETEMSLGGMWEGPANRVFHKAFMHDITQLRNFHNAITAYIMALYAAISKYMHAEQRNTRIARIRTYNVSNHCDPAPVVPAIPADSGCESEPSVVPNYDDPEDIEPDLKIR